MPQKGRKDCPGWYRLKLYLEGINRKAEEAARAGGLPSLRSSKVPIYLETTPVFGDNQQVVVSGSPEDENDEMYIPFVPFPAPPSVRTTVSSSRFSFNSNGSIARVYLHT